MKTHLVIGQRKKLPSIERLNELFFYDPEDGLLFRKITINYKALAGQQAGYEGNTTYLRVMVDQEEYLVHRIIWKMLYGTEPHTLDHIDQNKKNNKQDNLREVTESQNVHNVNDERYIGVSGLRGVYPHKNKWRSVITLNKKKKHLGLFNSPEEARNAYLKESNNVW